MTRHYDLIVVGAGMAGASLAAEVGERANTLLIEAEARPGYHTTGRSAAFWSESYGGPGVQPLTTASGPALRSLGVLSPRGALTLGKSGQEHQIRAFADQYNAIGVEMKLLDRDALISHVPLLRPDWTCGAYEHTCCDIDVATLHQHYLAKASRAGAELRCRAQLAGAERTDRGWSVTLSDGSVVTGAVLANAAGAWADEVARAAGVRPVGVTPYRRTMVQLKVAPASTAALPLVLDLDSTFYFKPESGGLWLSPHDEIPSAPCDAAPEEMDVAIAMSRLEQCVDWPVERVEHRWAGLRSFAPDRLPVYGFASDDAAFFWFAGQGGFGIQTAPAAAEMGARLLLGEGGGNLDPAPFSPARFS